MYDKIAYLRLRVARLERLADLRPGLGTQDPCYVLERAKKNKADIAQVQYVKDVLENLPIVNHSSGRSGLADIPNSEREEWYGMTYPRRLKERVEKDTIEWGKGKRKKRLKVNIPHMTFSSHAQFRMDQRGVTVKQVEDVVMHWHKIHRGHGEAERLKEIAMQNREKHDEIKEQLDYFYRSLTRAEYQKQKDDMRSYNRGMEINHEYMGVFVGFVPQKDGSVDIKTVFNLNQQDQPYSSYNC
tara:strand:- start:550 stop:1275 length:726 start_codon:yes stop_codon:yes gene_type:complete